MNVQRLQARIVELLTKNAALEAELKQVRKNRRVFEEAVWELHALSDRVREDTKRDDP